MGATYLSHLVVDHHIVWFNITVHDSHTVTVVQSLKRTHTQKQITQVVTCHLDQKKRVFVTASSSHFSPSVVRTCRNGYRNLSTSGTTPTGEQKNVGDFCIKSDTSSDGKRKCADCTLKSVLLMHSKTSAGVLDCAAPARSREVKRKYCA